MSNLVAYIDAGTGSYLLAAIASGAAGVWFFVRSSFAKLRGRSLDDTVTTSELDEAFPEPESSPQDA